MPPNRRPWPPPPYSADGRRPRPDDDESGARILRSIGISSLVLGAVLGMVAFAGMLYLARGEYRPEDVLILLVACAAGACCIPSLLVGAVLSVAAGIQGHREARKAAQRPCGPAVSSDEAETAATAAGIMAAAGSPPPMADPPPMPDSSGTAAPPDERAVRRGRPCA
ncbi:hypothetical protein KIH79_05885 [Bifidobacterium sp. 82T10]|uniref:Uncharacterized protein n=1 Tax=Bifidobacterium miconis TaxID=2834435 RepID=A0ABS6WH02_9BIFI|nr:hypothetical protein [Bifidobacterium miconis]MBW3092481.1 hypothetical protein [Bifidobacterium miconis]